MTTITALTPELLAQYNNKLDDILYGEFEHLDENMFKHLYSGLSTIAGIKFNTKEREILFIETVFNYKLNFDKKNILTRDNSFVRCYDEIIIKNNCNYYLNSLKQIYSIKFNIFDNTFLTYEILVKFLLNDLTCFKKFEYSRIKTNIDKNKCYKMRSLANYCFAFNYNDWAESKFIQLTQDRLDEFETEFNKSIPKIVTEKVIEKIVEKIVTKEIIEEITVEKIVEYLQKNKLSADMKQDIISNLLAN
jgi:hypothetical protein